MLILCSPNLQDSKDSTDSGPSNLLHAEAGQALFNDVPPHDLTLDLSASTRNRAPPTRQRSKSDTFISSPTALEGPSFSFSGPNSANSQQQQPETAIDPRALDGSSPGWESFKASAMALRQHQGSALVTDEEDNYLSADMPSQAGPSARRRSVVESGPYDSLNQGGSKQQNYLVPPSPGGIRRSQSHGSGHKRGALSENYTASTFSPRDGRFSETQQSYNTQAYVQADGNRLLGGGYEPQTYDQNQGQYDIPNLPPMPTAFLSGGQENQYGPPTSSSIGDYSRQLSVDYGQQQPQHPVQQPNYQGYLPAMPVPYSMPVNAPFMHGGPYFPYPPAGVAFNPNAMAYNQANMGYDQEKRFVTGPDGLLDPGRMRRRSSVRSDTSGVSGLSGASDFTWESKTTEATKQAAKRRRKDPSAAKFVCEYCGETFTRAYNLKGHIRSHEGLKPFTCEVCNKGQFMLSDSVCDASRPLNNIDSLTGFARRHDLKRHELLHSGVKKYLCEACQTSFVRLDALQRHHKSEVSR